MFPKPSRCFILYFSLHLTDVNKKLSVQPLPLSRGLKTAQLKKYSILFKASEPKQLVNLDPTSNHVQTQFHSPLDAFGKLTQIVGKKSTTGIEIRSGASDVG